MEEPQRIGLTKVSNSYLDEMLDTINSDANDNNEKLIKFDLYRLAVAIGLKNNIEPETINDSTDSSFRINELDPEHALYISVQASKLGDSGEPVYRTVERLAEQGIRQFYDAYRSNMGKLPWDKILA